MPDSLHSPLHRLFRALFPWAAWAGLSLATGFVLYETFHVTGIFYWGTGITAVALLLYRWAQDAYRLMNILALFRHHHLLPPDFESPAAFWPWGPALGLRRVLRTAVAEYQRVSKKMKETTMALEKFVGATAAEKSMRSLGKPAMGGENKRVFCLFADVRGFTHMTERLKPEETVDVLNRIFTELESVITQYGGEINKYIGDAVFAHFRCPYHSEELAARNVLRASLRMQEAFDSLNIRLRQSYSQGIEIGLGIGITAGMAIQGSMGSPKRMEFTLIGDTVNLASRLCSIAKPGEILVNEEMAEMVQEYFDMTSQIPVELKGKSGFVVPYVIAGERLILTKGIAERGGPS
jgi:class 3 adenylate cyclase